MSSRLEGISSQLSALTRVVLGLDTPEEEESYRAGTGHPEHINIRHFTDFRAKSVMRELECGLSESTEEDVEISVGEDDQDSSRSPSRSEYHHHGGGGVVIPVTVHYNVHNLQPTIFA